MAVHRRADYFDNGGKHLTETDYRAFMDMGNDVQCYESRKTSSIANEVGKALDGDPTTFINGIIIPETRDAIGQEGYSGDRFGDVRPLGTVPAQNMNKTVKTGTLRLGYRICTVDSVNPDEMLDNELKYMPESLTQFNVLNRYPAGAPLTKAEIDALKKNKLRPCYDYHEDAEGKVDAVNFSNGVLCTGYIQLLDDAIQLFKTYFSTLIDKRFMYRNGSNDYEVYARRIVYDHSRLVKRCFNHVINEAAQIALKCEVISSDGTTFKGALHLSNPYGMGVSTPIDRLSADYIVSQALYFPLYNSYVRQGRTDLAALFVFIGGCFFSEDLEAQAK